MFKQTNFRRTESNGVQRLEEHHSQLSRLFTAQGHLGVEIQCSPPPSVERRIWLEEGESFWIHIKVKNELVAVQQRGISSWD